MDDLIFKVHTYRTVYQRLARECEPFFLHKMLYVLPHFILLFL